MDSGQACPCHVDNNEQKDILALRTTNTYSSQPELPDRPLPVLMEPSMQLGIEVLGWEQMSNFAQWVYTY